MSDPKPVNWNCPSPCNVRYRIGEETTIRGYHRQPWFSHFQVDCPHCNRTFISWQTPDVLLNAMLTQVPEDRCTIEFADFAPDDIVRQYATDKELDFIPFGFQPPDHRSVRRLNHDENIVLFFRFLLDLGEMP